MAIKFSFAVTTDRETIHGLVHDKIISSYSCLGGWSETETPYIYIAVQDVAEDDAEKFIATNQTNGQRFRKIIWRVKKECNMSNFRIFDELPPPGQSGATAENTKREADAKPLMCSFDESNWPLPADEEPDNHERGYN